MLVDFLTDFSSNTQSNEDKMENEKDEYIHYSCCSDGWGSYRSQINGTCPDCGIETVDGVAACGCNYSPVECKTCGSAPCNLSC